LKWSFLEKNSFSDVHFFGEKVHSLSVAPEPLAVWNKKLEGLESSELKKLIFFPDDMYPAAPEPISGFFFTQRTRTEGPLSYSKVVC
jgi:hypothetical protein